MNQNHNNVIHGPLTYLCLFFVMNKFCQYLSFRTFFVLQVPDHLQQWSFYSQAPCPTTWAPSCMTLTLRGKQSRFDWKWKLVYYIMESRLDTTDQDKLAPDCSPIHHRLIGQSLNLALGLLTSCCCHKTAFWGPPCYWGWWGSMRIGDPSKSH